MPVSTESQKNKMMENSLITRRKNKAQRMITSGVALCIELGINPHELFHNAICVNEQPPDWLERASVILLE